MVPIANTGLSLREEAALKHYLQGITVRDTSAPAAGRKVEVYYRMAEQEVRRRSYPYITIDLLSITRDQSREHRGLCDFAVDDEYLPIGRNSGQRVRTSWPVPLTLTFQITSFARSVQHDLQIMTALMTNQLTERFAAVPMLTGTEVLDDHSIRRLDVVSGPMSMDGPDSQDPLKRLFRKAWTVEMSSEYFPEELKQLALVAPDKIFIDLDTTN